METGFELSLTNSRFAGKPRRITADILISVMAFAGIFGVVSTLWRWDEISGQILPAAIFGMVFMAAILFILASGKGKMTGLSIVLFSLFICAVFFRQRIASGCAVILDQCAAVQSERLGKIILGYAPAGSNGTDVIFALAAFAVILGIFIALLIYYLPWLALPVSAGVCVLSVIGHIDINGWTLVLYIALLSLLVKTRSGSGHFQDAGAARNGIICIMLISVITASAVLLSGFGGNWDLSAAKQTVLDTVHKLRYGGAKQPMPEGKLRGMEALRNENAKMLTVTMERPESLYLRSFVGQMYTGGSWETLPPEKRAGYSDVFYWLHKNDFYGENQLAKLSGLLSGNTESFSVTIRNHGACRENYITPYELSGNADFMDETAVGDEITNTKRFMGVREYSYETAGNRVKLAYELLFELEKRQTEPELRDYMLSEAAYRGFVYDTNLQLTDTVIQTLYQHLGDRPAERLSAFEAKHRIQEFLKDTVGYEESAGIPASADDALTYFLQTSKKGYSVQYATAATLALRYYGIPARYVEGFLITPADAAKTSGGVFELTGASMHAWAEYYEDGIGFIPFETTPVYSGVMEESQWLWFEKETDSDILSEASAKETLDSQTGQKNDMENSQNSELPSADSSSESESQMPPWKTRPEDAETIARKTNITILWKVVLSVLLFTLLSAAAAVFVRRKQKLKHRAELFEHKDNAYAISCMFAHSMEMMWRSGIEKKNSSLFESREKIDDWFGGENGISDMLILNQKALFSNQSLTRDDRMSVSRFMGKSLVRLKEKGNVWQRLYLKWICCIY